MFAGARKLDNLVVVVDNSGLQIDGNVADVCSPLPHRQRNSRLSKFPCVSVAERKRFRPAGGALRARQIKGVAIVKTDVKRKKAFCFAEARPAGTKKLPTMRYGCNASLEKAGEALCQK